MKYSQSRDSLNFKESILKAKKISPWPILLQDSSILAGCAIREEVSTVIGPYGFLLVEQRGGKNETAGAVATGTSPQSPECCFLGRKKAGQGEPRQTDMIIAGANQSPSWHTS